MSSGGLPRYCYVVDDAAGKFFEAEVAEYGDRAQTHFHKVWRRLSEAVAANSQIESVPSPAWANWKPWDWCKSNSPDLAGRKKYVAFCGDTLIGFLNVWHDFPSVAAPGERSLYVEHLAASPGNQPTELWARRYYHVGTMLFAYAVQLSLPTTSPGRISLHAADTSALGFYRRLQGVVSQSLFFPEVTGITGPTPHSNDDASKAFLETQPAAALELLSNYRDA